MWISRIQDYICNFAIFRVNLNYTEEICSNIQEHKDEQVFVQKHTQGLRIYTSVLTAIPAGIMALLAGKIAKARNFIECSLFKRNPQVQPLT